jgi:hypothetical protein
MNKTLNALCSVLLMLIAVSVNLSAQQQPATAPLDAPGHIFTVTMLKLQPNQVGEFLDFWEKHFVPLEKNIPEILSSKVLQHRWGPSDYMVMIIHEYDSLGAIEKAQKQQEGAMQRQATTDPQAAEAFKKFQTFVPGHVDYIMFAPERVRKYGSKE